MAAPTRPCALRRRSRERRWLLGGVLLTAQIQAAATSPPAGPAPTASSSAAPSSIAIAAAPPAATIPTVSTPKPPAYLLGFGGRRQRLEEAGVELRADTVLEGFQVTHGGLHQGHHSDWQLHLTARLDMDKLLDWRGGMVQIAVNDRGGHSTSDDLTGSMLPVQNVYGGEFWRLTELSYRQFLAGDNIALKLGFITMGDDFGYQKMGCQLLSSTFCAHAPSMSRNSGWYNNPIARWGFDYQEHWGAHWAVRAGVFQVNPRYSNNDDDRSNAFNLFASGNTGAILPLEVEWTPGRRQTYPGHYKLGVYYDTSHVRKADQNGDASGRHGSYLLLDQTLYHEKAKPGRGLRAFVQWMYSDAATAMIAHWYAGGLAYQGFFNRDQDTLTLGYAQANMNRHRLATLPLTEREHPPFALAEKVFELTYRAHLTPWLVMSPDVQYLIDPGVYSFQPHPNALLFGLQTQISL